MKYLNVIILVLLICSSCSQKRTQTDVHVLVDTSGSNAGVALPSTESIMEHVTGSRNAKKVGGNFGSLSTYVLTGYTGIKQLDVVDTNDPGNLWMLEKAYVAEEVEAFRVAVNAALNEYYSIQFNSEASRLYRNICSFLHSLPQREGKDKHIVYLCSDLMENTSDLSVYIDWNNLRKSRDAFKRRLLTSANSRRETI